MKKYKIIKLYPGGPKLGSIESPNSFGIIFSHISIHDKAFIEEYLEEVTEKDYEIIKFKDAVGNIFYRKQEDNLFTINLQYSYTEEKLLNNNTSIHTVIRLSDDEIFTVGDKVKTESGWSGKIENFNITTTPHRIRINTDHAYLENCQLDKKPLFITKDGVDVFEDCLVYGITSDTWKVFFQYASHVMNEKWVHGKFSTEKAAKDHIVMNKPSIDPKDLDKFMSPLDVDKIIIELGLRVD